MIDDGEDNRQLHCPLRTRVPTAYSIVLTLTSDRNQHQDPTAAENSHQTVTDRVQLRGHSAHTHTHSWLEDWQGIIAEAEDRSQDKMVVPLNEEQLAKALENARQQGLPYDWNLALDVSIVSFVLNHWIIVFISSMPWLAFNRLFQHGWFRNSIQFIDSKWQPEAMIWNELTDLNHQLQQLLCRSILSCSQLISTGLFIINPAGQRKKAVEQRWIETKEFCLFTTSSRLHQWKYKSFY